MDFTIAFTPENVAIFLTLFVLEVVLGVDNVIFISVLASKLPKEQQARARNLGLTLAMIRHLNVPTMVLTSTIVNPVTALPVYYFAYRVGALLLNHRPGNFQFDENWLQTGLGVVWKPFLLGCLVCAVVLGYGGTKLLDLLWRINLKKRWQTRREAARAKKKPRP